jgi:uncharacterized damage-inducible protein DinB
MNAKEIVGLLHEGFDAKAWHGPNLLAALRGVDADEATWRPAPERHNIREIAIHCAYWKLRVLARTTGDRERFPYPGADWARLPDRAGESEWRADRRYLSAVHERLVEAVMRLGAAELSASTGANGKSKATQLVGIAFHDVYHAGQIRLVRRLRETKRRSRASAATGRVEQGAVGGGDR